jgi:branched-chain amino acid transport system substrate-binding protein
VTSGTRPAGDVAGADVQAFLIADVRGYTRYTNERGDEAAAELAATFAALARRAIEGRGGTLLELRGDEALGVFTSARAALRAAVDLQALVRGRDDRPGLPLGVGVGVDVGEAVAVEGGYRGGALNLAARLCSLAAPGEILTTETVTSLARRVEGIHYEERGTQRLKGIERPVRVVQVLIEAEAPASASGRRASWRRFRRRHLTRRRVLVLAVLSLLAAIAIGAVVLESAGGKAAGQAAGALSLDSASGDSIASVGLGTSPSQVAIGEGSVWVLDADDKTVSQIDPETREVVRTFSTSSTPTDIAAGAGALWVGNAGLKDNDRPESVSRIDTESGVIISTVELARTPRGIVYGFGGPSRQRVAVSPDAVWAIGGDGTLARIDPRSDRVVAEVEDVEASNVAVGEGRVWVSENEHLVEIDPARNAVARRIPVDGSPSGSIAIGAGAVWFADPENGRVVRVSTGAKPRQTSIELDPWVAGVAFGEGAVWAVNELGDTIYRIDPRDNSVIRIDATAPRAIAAGDGGVWAATAAAPSRDAALPSSVCGDVYFEGDGEPDVLLVSDLTLKGETRPYTQPMVDAIRQTLEQRDFEAGALAVGYQSCDNATAQSGGLDFFRCAANAKAYARNLRVVAVFGSWASPCSYAQIPITNDVEGGPLAMLSPSNTFEDLTLDDELYPAGIRSFFRLAAPNNTEAAAHIELARQLGHDRVYLLTSEWDEYGQIFVDTARRAARRAGGEIVGHRVFDHEADGYDRLVAQVARKQPEAVMVAAVLTEGSGALVQELGAALGPNVPLIAPDGFRAIDEVVALTGPAADSLYVTEYGIPNDKLPPRGRQFLEGFAAAHGGEAGPDRSASYGAQGAELLLDAIGRSDGSRASVLDEIRKSRIEDGILGDISFDRVGDLRERPIAVYRVEDKAFVTDRVIVVRPPRVGGP